MNSINSDVFGEREREIAGERLDKLDLNESSSLRVTGIAMK